MKLSSKAGRTKVVRAVALGLALGLATTTVAGLASEARASTQGVLALASEQEPERARLFGALGRPRIADADALLGVLGDGVTLPPPAS